MSSIKKKVNDKNPHVALYALEVVRLLHTSRLKSPCPVAKVAELHPHCGLACLLGSGMGVVPQMLRLTDVGPEG